MKNKGEIIFYHPENTLEIEVRLEDETVWLTQAQMVELFQRDVSVISRHINKVFKEGELEKKSNLHFLQIANSDKPLTLYSLDVIISVGYRVKSQRGTMFRQWANRVLKEYLLNGYSINQRFERIESRLCEHDQKTLDLQRHNAQYEPIIIKQFKQSHDRFLLIDEKDIYHIGASLKDLGKKWFAFSKLNLDINDIIRKIV